jgi:hypothetical protein
MSMGDKYSNLYLLLVIISVILVHIGSIFTHIEYLYSAFFMTNTFMLIRGFGAGNVFKKVPLHDVVAYMPYNTHFGSNQKLKIVTKDGKIFTLTNLDNREELIDVLKSFTNSVEKTC